MTLLSVLSHIIDRIATPVVALVVALFIAATAHALHDWLNPMTKIGADMQYFDVTCAGDQKHKVCRTDDMEFYFNFTDGDNLSPAAIDSLRRKL